MFSSTNARHISIISPASIMFATVYVNAAANIIFPLVDITS